LKSSAEFSFWNVNDARVFRRRMSDTMRLEALRDFGYDTKEISSAMMKSNGNVTAAADLLLLGERSTSVGSSNNNTSKTTQPVNDSNQDDDTGTNPYLPIHSQLPVQSTVPKQSPLAKSTSRQYDAFPVIAAADEAKPALQYIPLPPETRPTYDVVPSLSAASDAGGHHSLRRLEPSTNLSAELTRPGVISGSRKLDAREPTLQIAPVVPVAARSPVVTKEATMRTRPVIDAPATQSTQTVAAPPVMTLRSPPITRRG
jgi:hypothetical protein